MKILAVDDDPLILNLLKQVLTFSGYIDVAFAESAEQAAQIIAQASPPFECMLIDMRMPGVKGEELCYWARQFPEYTETPIVMVTALSKKSDIDRAFAAGASDYITKPLVIPDFISRIDQIRLQIEKCAYCKRKGADVPAKAVGRGRIDFTQPMRLGGINGEIEIGALENYLFQLSKSGIRDMDAFSFAIKDAAKLHFVCSREEFFSILKATGTVISQHLSAPQFFLSYTGYGAFTGVAQEIGNCESVRDEIECKVQGKLNDIQIPSSSGAPIGVIPYMSVPQKLSVWHGQNAVDILYRAIVDAEIRCGPALLAA